MVCSLGLLQALLTRSVELLYVVVAGPLGFRVRVCSNNGAGCQNYSPFLDPHDNTAPGYPKRDHDFGICLMYGFWCWTPELAHLHPKNPQAPT